MSVSPAAPRTPSTTEIPLDEVLRAQTSSGAFPSRVVLDRASGRTEPDENVFVTALVVHHLRELVAALPPVQARRVAVAMERGLDFIETCRLGEPPRRRPLRWGEEVAGAFRFYPPGTSPEWMQTRLAPDVDDTCLALSVLFAAGRVSRAEVLDVVDRVIDPHRVHDPARGARWPWGVRGAALTWIDPRAADNPVDATVNANFAALLARLDRRDHPAYAPAAATVQRAVEWAGECPERAGRVTPFYPDPAELGRAVERAVEAGAGELVSQARRLSELPWSSPHRRSVSSSHLSVCGSADGRVLWLAPTLHAVRKLIRHPPLFREELEK